MILMTNGNFGTWMKNENAFILLHRRHQAGGLQDRTPGRLVAGGEAGKLTMDDR
jgi:hypothetical protein